MALIQVLRRLATCTWPNTVRPAGKLCLVFCVLGLSPTASALEFKCTASDETRFIKVEIPGEQYLCEVSITYQETGRRDVKWYARNDTLFCSAKAYELRDKHTNLWNYSCETWPDRDGIDQLSPSQRIILDRRLKDVIAQGKNATPAFSVTGVKAAASTPVDNEPGKMGLQFFTNQGDFTEIIDHKADQWQLVTTLHPLAEHIVSDTPVASALIHGISDDGTIEVHTQLFERDNTGCFGAQIMTPVGTEGAVKVRTPHHYICRKQ